VISKHRTLALDELDVEPEESKSEASGVTKCDQCQSLREKDAKSSKENKCTCSGTKNDISKSLKTQSDEAQEKNDQGMTAISSSSSAMLDKSNVDPTNTNLDNLVTSQTRQDSGGSADGTKRTFNLVDIIPDAESAEGNQVNICETILVVILVLDWIASIINFHFSIFLFLF